MALKETEQVQTNIGIENTFHAAVDYADYHLTGCADNGSAQMPSEHCTAALPGAHVQMRVVFAVHPRDVADEGDDLPIAGKAVVPVRETISYAP